MSLWIITACRNRKIPSDLKSQYRNTGAWFTFRQVLRAIGNVTGIGMSPATTVYLSAFCGRARLLQRGAISSSAIFQRKLIPSGMCCLFTPAWQNFIQTTYIQWCAKKQSNLVHTWGIASPYRTKRGYANADSGSTLLEWISREKIEREKEKNVKDTKGKAG